MIKYIIYSVSIFIQLSIYAQTNRNGISKIEKIDSLLIGKKINQALRILELDSNWTIIQEPPMIAQGIRIDEINGYSIQLFTRRIPFRKFRQGTSKKMNYSKILNYRIIGVAWKTDCKYKSTGQIIPQYAPDKYGSCNK